MSLDLGAFPEQIAGLANLAILLFFLAVGLLIAAFAGMPPGPGVLIGIVAWVFFLMAPERIRIGNLWLLTIGLGLGSAIMSGTGFGAAAGRDGGPGFWVLGAITVATEVIACFFIGIVPVLAAAGVCHLIGVVLASRDMNEALEDNVPGISSVGPTVACTALVAIFSVLYLPAAWPVWPILHAGATAVGFLGGYAANG